ncbi:succinate dehydrogenase, hydrophobic membrane anchor protein [Tabrizicola sp.]|uniref:succinate dehydrogenase, hydrophobic membrane anchor protein n=1 Tax=Tabrizicola sp. TaxID=2005166 RepID=UPI002FDD32BB
MQFMTDRKRAEGLGSARSGTHHHWRMMVSSAALIVLVPLFIFTFGSALGRDHPGVLEFYARPFPAVVAALTLIVVALHCKAEAEEAIIDYVHGVRSKILLWVVAAAAYAMIAAGLFALVRMAL